MTIIKHEPDFAELVDHAAERKKILIDGWNQSIYDLYDESNDSLAMVLCCSYTSCRHTKASSISTEPVTPSPTNPPVPLKSKEFIRLSNGLILKYSALGYIWLTGPLIYPREIVICLAILSLLFRLSDATLRESTKDLSDIFDVVVNSYFLLEGMLRLCTIPAVFEIRRRHFDFDVQPANSLAYEILRCGWVEMLISILSVAIFSTYRSPNAICWFHLFRLSFIANCFVSESPQIEVLLSGIYSGLRSIASTWFLLVITFVIYGVLCTASFRDNDPGHFSTVGTSMFTLFRISTMDSWSEVNYINAYGCDSVPSNYVVIDRNDSRPRYIDVTSGRMYLFLCDTPTSHPYLSSFIFISFVVLTGFMLISLTVAAVSGGVHTRLEGVAEYDVSEVDIDDDSSHVDEPPTKEEDEKEICRAMRNHTFFGKRSETIPNIDKLRAKAALVGQRTSFLRGKPNPMKISSMEESNEVEDEKVEEDSSSQGDQIMTSSDIEPEGQLLVQDQSKSILPVAQLLSSSRDVNDDLDPKMQSIHLPRNTLQIQVPLLHDKELLRMMLTQMWNDIEREKEDQPEDATFNTTSQSTSRSNLTRLLSSLSDSSHLSPVQSPTRFSQNIQPNTSQLVRHNSFYQHASNVHYSSKRIVYTLKNALSSYFYIGYIILIVLVTASVQIYCTNKNNCHAYWGLFIAIQILLSLDISLRILTNYPNYKIFFLYRTNLFDLGVVLIIWISIFYTGYGSQIAASARIIYLLRLLPFLAWVTDLQVIMLSIVSSIRPLLYVVGMMLLMFFHFAVAGVLIFKRNDEFYFVCTLDSWGDIAFKNMYGCDFYGSDTGIDEVDSMCQTPQGLGWIAAWYFLIFITFSVMILQSLFVGIVISALELLKDVVRRKSEMWKLIYQRVEKLGLQNSTLVNLLDIFNVMDSNFNGYLRESDLDPLLKVLPPMPSLPPVNCKVKGHYTFPEFIDLLHLIGLQLHKVSRSPR